MATRKLTVLATACAAVLCLALDLRSTSAQTAHRAARFTAKSTNSKAVTQGFRTQQITLAAVRGRQEFIPPLASGDREFAGHGPEVWVGVEFFIENNALYRRVSMSALETANVGAAIGNKHTQARGTSDKHRVYRAPHGKKLVAMKGAQLSGRMARLNLVHTIMNGHAPRTFNTALGKVTVWGDRRGNDAGIYTRTAIDFDFELPVLLQDAASLDRVVVELPRDFRFVPGHTRGDRDFKGHGPHVHVYVGIAHGPREIRMVVSMKAKETKRDWTTAEGTLSEVLYIPPPGWKIKNVVGAFPSTALVDYVDSDHWPDEFDTRIGKLAVYGDHKGNDAGRYTRMEFKDVRYRMLVELERAY